MRPLAFAGVLALIALASPTSAQVAQTYLYDANGRLIAATTGSSTIAAYSGYTLDDADNRTAAAAAVPSVPSAPDTLGVNEVLVPTMSLTNGSYALTLMASGDLVVTGPGSTIVQHSCTAAGRSMYLTVTSSGYLILNDPSFTPIWSRPAGSPSVGAVLKLSNTGVVTLVNGATTVWSSSVTGGGCFS